MSERILLGLPMNILPLQKNFFPSAYTTPDDARYVRNSDLHRLTRLNLYGKTRGFMVSNYRYNQLLIRRSEVRILLGVLPPVAA